MKYTIEGFSQEYATTLRKKVERNGKTVEIKVDCTDLVILRWFVDFYPKMRKMDIDGTQYAFVTYKRLTEDLPLIDISKRAFAERLKKLTEFDILTYKYITEGGVYTFYGFGKNYENFIDGKAQKQTQSESTPFVGQTTTPCRLNSNPLSVEQQPLVGQTTPINNNINSSIIDKSISNNITPRTREELPSIGSREGNESQQAFIGDFGILIDNYTVKYAEMDFGLLYTAYEQSEYLRTDTQARYLSWICKHYDKIVGGYYKDRPKRAPKPKKKTNMDILREMYQEALEEEQQNAVNEDGYN